MNLEYFTIDSQVHPTSMNLLNSMCKMYPISPVTVSYFFVLFLVSNKKR